MVSRHHSPKFDVVASKTIVTYSIFRRDDDPKYRNHDDVGNTWKCCDGLMTVSNRVQSQ